ncbi:flagellar biosynthetic protein FliO [Marinobacter zhejiangensis]|uniref:Flagellar protein n=1 Tax=Marinobacter zhejiangensis TaxID=488535 RepID=A0A1I4NNT7_9GAMM|nr:flagellar biosynthetic protein FliO [Marinobacter zhejiangensis]SFM17194.1 flagellar protein FliO/FliZ [Marinobacter zhejiangensis]
MVRVQGLIGVALMLPALVQAAEEVSQSPSPVSSPAGSLASLGLGLVVVIALIFGCAWLVRRMSGIAGMNSQLMKVVAVMNLGTRERIALIDVGGKQILLGITPSTIRTLHVFDEPVASPEELASSDFARRLQGMIGRSWKGGATSGGDPS